nr:DUF3800 domain-containing protein [uncultured Bdellovibrio sp.]
MISAFVDESGNSGANYLDANQPYFILAGWLLFDSNIDAVEDAILKWEKSLNSQAGEVKGANLVKRIKGRKSIIELLKILSSLDALPVYSIMEKRFGLCAKFVESIFDSYYNPAITKDFFEDPEVRYSLAVDLYDSVTDEMIFNFGRAIQSRDRDLAETQFHILKNHALSLGVDHFNRCIPPCPEEKSINYLLNGDNISSAINNTMLLTLISNLENFIRSHAPSEWVLYHDNIQTFSSSLQSLQQRMGEGWADFLRQEFSAPIPAGKYLIKDLIFLNSAEKPLIRAADCMSSLLRYYLERVDDDSLFHDKVDQTGIMMTLGPVMRHMTGGFPPLYHEVISTKVGAKVFKRLRQSLDLNRR